MSEAPVIVPSANLSCGLDGLLNSVTSDVYPLNVNAQPTLSNDVCSLDDIIRAAEEQFQLKQLQLQLQQQLHHLSDKTTNSQQQQKLQQEHHRQATGERVDNLLKTVEDLLQQNTVNVNDLTAFLSQRNGSSQNVSRDDITKFLSSSSSSPAKFLVDHENQVSECDALKVLSELKTLNLNSLNINKGGNNNLLHLNHNNNFDSNSNNSIQFQLSPRAVPMNKDEKERELLLALSKIIVPTPTPSPPANAARPKNPPPVSVPSLKSLTPPRTPTKTSPETETASSSDISTHTTATAVVVPIITTTASSPTTEETNKSDDADLPGDLELESPSTETKEQQQIDPAHAVCIKAFYKDDVRRIMFDSRTGFQKLVEQTKKIYPFGPTLKYRDDDCELVTIGCDDDLNEALRLLRISMEEEGALDVGCIPTLRLYVFKPDKKKKGSSTSTGSRKSSGSAIFSSLTTESSDRSASVKEKKDRRERRERREDKEGHSERRKSHNRSSSLSTTTPSSSASSSASSSSSSSRRKKSSSVSEKKSHSHSSSKHRSRKSTELSASEETPSASPCVSPSGSVSLSDKLRLKQNKRQSVCSDSSSSSREGTAGRTRSASDATGSSSHRVRDDHHSSRPRSVSMGSALGLTVRGSAVPDGEIFSPGELFTQAWKVKNIGRESWPESTEIVFIGCCFVNDDGEEENVCYDESKAAELDAYDIDSSPADSASVGVWVEHMNKLKMISHKPKRMQSPPSLELKLSPPVKPGEEIEIKVPVTAPIDEGSFTGYWRLKSKGDNTFFGPIIHTSIQVVAPPTTMPPPPPTVSPVIKLHGVPSPAQLKSSSNSSTTTHSGKFLTPMSATSSGGSSSSQLTASQKLRMISKPARTFVSQPR